MSEPDPRRTITGAATTASCAGSVRLGRTTWPDIEARQGLTLLIPLGATEQHGPHLPLDTDTVIAEAWATAAAERVSDAVVAPALPYGASGEHQSFAGTLSIGEDALVHVMVELARSASHRFRRVVFVSGHAGNAGALSRAVDQLRQEGHDVDAVLPRLAGADAHAGETETSMLLFLAPSSVRLDRAAPGNTRPLSELIDTMRSGGVAAVSANGVLGDPTDAAAEQGAIWFEALVEWLAASLD